MRGASWATVGASKMARTGTPTSRALLMAAITRIAEMLSPPRSKKESSTPTRCTPSTWA
ncbi:putative actinomycin synthetase II [Mycobacterium avium MAV_120709_2344]|nr:putative actinomycin synthetase II [Mycobacterium avium MAV_120709_2344]